MARPFEVIMIERNEILKAYGRDYKAMTLRLLEKAGLAEDLDLKRGGRDKASFRVMLKPNLIACIPAKFGATTHTELVEAVIEYLKDREYTNITIAEGSWVGDRTAEAYDILGYNNIAKRYGVKIIDCQKDTSYEADCAGMKLHICSCYRDADFLINMPVLKGHCQTRITCALKNMKGLIPNSEKRRFHTMGLHKPIAHLNTHIRQDFIIIDHICGDPDFEEGGNPLVRNCVMAAKDPVLVDAYTAEILGYRPEDVSYIKLAESLGVGSADTDSMRIITVEGENCEDLPDTHKIMQVSYAVEDIDSCSACYGMLIGALNRLSDEGLLAQLKDKVAIGQGYRGKTGSVGVGACTRLFDYNIPGCPPSEEEIYEALKARITAD